MSFTNQAGDGASWPATVEQAENGDGTSSFWSNTFVPLLNRTKYLYDKKANLTGAAFTGDITTTGLVNATNGFISAGGAQLGGNAIISGFVTVVGAVKSDSYFDVKAQGSPPANPASGYLRLWWDGTNLKALESSGTSHTIF